MDLDDIKVDSKALSAGVWVSEVPGGGNLRFKVRGSSNPAVKELRARKERAVDDSKRDAFGNLNEDEAERINTEMLYEGLLLDWDNVVVGGKSVKYSKEAAKELLTDPDRARFRGLVLSAIIMAAQGKHDKEQAVVKN